MRSGPSITLTLVLIGLAVTPAAAGRQKPGNKQQQELLALEVRFEKGLPSFVPIAATGTTARGALFSRFGRVVSWKSPDGSPPVSAVRVVPVPEGSGVRVSLSVLLGPNHDKERSVADYIVQKNQTITTRELAGFGVEPFELKLVAVTDPASLTPPSITNNTISIESVGVKPDQSLLATFIVTVRNNAPRRVLLLDASVISASSSEPIPVRPQGIEGRSLIEPGATYEFRAAGGGRDKDALTDFDSVPPAPTAININGVVFDDGSYEGDPKAAADYLSIQAGCWWQLKKVTALLAAANAPGADLTALKVRVLGLGDVPTRKEIGEIPAKYVFPDPEVQFDAVGDFKFGARRVREMLLADIAAFEKGHPAQDKTGAKSDDVQAWLTKVTARYSGWFSRM